LLKLYVPGKASGPASRRAGLMLREPELDRYVVGELGWLDHECAVADLSFGAVVRSVSWRNRPWNRACHFLSQIGHQADVPDAVLHIQLTQLNAFADLVRMKSSVRSSPSASSSVTVRWYSQSQKVTESAGLVPVGRIGCFRC
jgi:hypothetical protein